MDGLVDPSALDFDSSPRGVGACVDCVCLVVERVGGVTLFDI